MPLYADVAQRMAEAEKRRLVEVHHQQNIKNGGDLMIRIGQTKESLARILEDAESKKNLIAKLEEDLQECVKQGFDAINWVHPHVRNAQQLAKEAAAREAVRAREQELAMERMPQLFKQAVPVSQPSEPALDNSCPKCGSPKMLHTAWHRTSEHSICVLDIKKAKAAGLSVSKMLSEGNVTVSELQDLGIPVPAEL
jgi:hypothetical protein